MHMQFSHTKHMCKQWYEIENLSVKEANYMTQVWRFNYERKSQLD